MSTSVIYSLSLPSGATTYSATTLTAALTTIITTTSVYTTEGRILTTSRPVATVFQAGETLIFPDIPKPPKKGSNLVVIIAASLGGFIFLVLIGVGIIVYKRRARRQRARRVPPSPPTPVHTFPAGSIIEHSSSPITPFGYRSPEHAQPHHDPHLMTEVRNNQHNFVLAPPSQPLSEKQRRNMLQRNQQQQRSQQQLNQAGMMSRSSVDETGSIISQPYTNSSVISSSVAAQGQQQYSQQQPFTTPGHQHQRSRSTNSTTELMYSPDGRSTSPVTIRSAESPPQRLGPSPSYFASVNANMAPAPGMQAVTEEEAMAGPDVVQYYPQEQQQPNPRNSVAYTHSQPQSQPSYQYPIAGGSSGPASSSQAQAGSSSGGGGASVTVNRGTGDREEVILAKNNTIRQGRNRVDGDIDERLTNLSELPPTYDSVQQNRMRHG